ncbi:MAG TPA: Uma2 family endonuclease [Longimicrobiaceae bacterium]|nr:Uma2 family endonuclease [Longimicrobiaceae bacterium]
MAVQFAEHYRFTADEYTRMAAEGIIPPGARVELIEGEIIEMSPIGSRHNAFVDRVTRVLVGKLGDEAIVRVQGSIQLGDRVVPQPDFAVLRPRDDFYVDALPGPADVLLLVEVADSSLAYDRSEKSRLYARYGIPEYWLLDLVQNTVLVHTDPGPSTYQHVEIRNRGETWNSRSLPGLRVTGEEILG